MAKGAYIGVPEMTINPVFADNSWEQIIYACRNNEVPDTWAIGDQKAMTIGDNEYLIDIIGKHHDTFADNSGTAPLTFQMHDLYGTTYAMNISGTNSEGWTESDMRNTHLPAILALMPSEVQAGIREVIKLTSVGSQSATIGTTADKLFLLSEVEVFGSAAYSKSGEGTQYAYYAENNGTLKYLNGNANGWRLRSPSASNSTHFCRVDGGGGQNHSIANSALGVSFAFCFGGTPIPTTARKIKKGYIGIEGLARKIKKAYIGIGGVARPCWSGGELAYYGAITPLSEARMYVAATTVGDYALFGGGVAAGATYSATVDSYTTSLTRNPVSPLSIAKQELAATTVGNYALFGGGGEGSTTSIIYDTVDGYTASLTKNNPNPLSVARRSLAATTVGNYALFGGGTGNSGRTAKVDAYDSNLTLSSASDLSGVRTYPAAGTVGNYALFAGGSIASVNTADGYTTSVNAYDTSKTQSNPTALSQARGMLAATTVGENVLFGGGRQGRTQVATVDAYNASLTRSTLTNLSSARQGIAATTVGNYALFGGGSGFSPTVDVYDVNLTHSTITNLSVGRYEFAATTVGDYALFGGGNAESGRVSTVDAYTVA